MTMPRPGKVRRASAYAATAPIQVIAATAGTAMSRLLLNACPMPLSTMTWR